MNCTQARELITAYTDNELEIGQALELEKHLAECVDCNRLYREQRALRTVVREEAPYHRMPDTLRARLDSNLKKAADAGGRKPVPVRRNRWLELGLATAAGMLIAVSMTSYIPRPSGTGITDEIVAGHVRSLMAEHLADVASSDHHTVKPWFAGKLDYSPPVRDLAAVDFPLEGGRLDYIGGRAVAALVYRHHQHVVNLYVWPSANTDAMQATTREGYNLVHWADNGMSYWAVSDMNQTELEDFARALRQPESAPG